MNKTFKPDFATQTISNGEQTYKALSMPEEWKDGREVTLGVDFELDCGQRDDFCTESECPSMAECKWKEVIAVPVWDRGIVINPIVGVPIPVAEQGKGSEIKSIQKKMISSLK